MASTAIEEHIEEEFLSKEDVYQNWKENAPKVMFGEHPIIFEFNDFDEFFIQKAKEELRETPEIITESCAELRELIAGESDLNVPNEEDFYKIFLRPCKYYPKSAFTLLKRFYQFRQNYPHIYTDLCPSKEKTAICANLIYPLPFRAKDGSRIVVIEGGKQWNPKKVSTNAYFKGLILMLYVAMMENKTQIAGARIIIDVEGLSLSHVTYLSPNFAKMLIEFIQKCLPIRLKSIHVVKQSFFFKMAFAIFKPFLEEKIRKRIYFHGTNWETLMTFIDKKALLKKHGGQLEMPDEQFGVKIWQNLLFAEYFFKVEQHYGYNINNKI